MSNYRQRPSRRPRTPSNRPPLGRYSNRRPPPPRKFPLSCLSIAALVGIGAIILLALIFGLRTFINEDPIPTVPQAQVTTSPSTASTTPTPLAVLPTMQSVDTATMTTIPLTPTPVPENTVLSMPTQTSEDLALQPENLSDLQQYMLRLVNKDRQANGLSQVGWDEVATIASQRHAEEMAQFDYLSHWNQAGYGPDYRYSLAGGLDSLRENVHITWLGGAAKPSQASDFASLIRNAQESLMNSPGHRANILTPEHTHVGVGIAYYAEEGRLTIAQGFVGQYIRLESLPLQLSLGDTILLSGHLMSNVSNPLLNLAYEPLPSPLTVIELNETSTYTSPSEIYEALDLQVDSEGSFAQEITLNQEGQAGLYHVRVWVDGAEGQLLASNVIIEVR